MLQCSEQDSRRGLLALMTGIRNALDSIIGLSVEVLKSFGFSENFIGWVSINFYSARISILVDGSSKGCFMCFRGVRQGDPLSPFFFAYLRIYE